MQSETSYINLEQINLKNWLLFLTLKKSNKNKIKYISVPDRKLKYLHLSDIDKRCVVLRRISAVMYAGI